MTIHAKTAMAGAETATASRGGWLLGLVGSAGLLAMAGLLCSVLPGLLHAASAGAALGALVAAPIGPVGLLLIHRTLADGPSCGLATGIGAATTHAVYGAAASVGAAGLVELFGAAAAWLCVLSSAMLLGMAWRAWHQPVQVAHGPFDARGIAGAYVTTVALAAISPMTLLSFALLAPAVIAGLPANLATVSAAASGVFVGSVSWWLVLTAVATLARRFVGPATLTTVNRVVALLLAAAALALAGRCMVG